MQIQQSAEGLLSSSLLLDPMSKIEKRSLYSSIDIDELFSIYSRFNDITFYAGGGGGSDGDASSSGCCASGTHDINNGAGMGGGGGYGEAGQGNG